MYIIFESKHFNNKFIELELDKGLLMQQTEEIKKECEMRSWELIWFYIMLVMNDVRTASLEQMYSHFV